MKQVWQSLGQVNYGPTKEEASLGYRRSLYISEDVKKGDVLTPKNLRIARPGLGLAPKHYNVLMWQRVNRSVKKGTAMKGELIDL